MTIAHISDLHLSPDYFPERTAIFRSILEQCIKSSIGHIVISGDVTNQAKKNEFEHFRNVLKEYDLLDGKKTTIVPGNHDIYGGPYHAEDVLDFPSKCKITDYQENLSVFYQHTKELFSNTEIPSKKSLFPFIKVVNNIVLLGLNSVAPWNVVKNPLGSNGAIDDKQFELMESVLSDQSLKGKRILVVVHHHFHKQVFDTSRSKLERLWSAIEASTMKLRKKKRLLKLFARHGVEGILHGHVHRQDEYFRKHVRCFNAGGSIIPSRHAPQLFNVLTVRESGIELTAVPVNLLQAGHGKITAKRRIRTLAAA